MGVIVIQSLVRGLEVLEYVADRETVGTAADIAALLDVKSTTAFNLAKTLTHQGYLARSASRPVRYRLGPAAYELIARRERGDLCRRAEVAVRRLVTAIPEATVLFVRAVGHEIAISLRMDPSRRGVLQRPLNKTVMPYSTATAICYQAFWSMPERDAFQRHHPFEEYGGAMWRDRAHLDAELRASRKRGFVVMASRKPLVVAVPVYGSDRDLAGTLGLSLPEDDTVTAERRESIVTGVREAGAELSRSVPAENSAGKE